VTGASAAQGCSAAAPARTTAATASETILCHGHFIGVK
jgi:hypothetical protein